MLTVQAGALLVAALHFLQEEQIGPQVVETQSQRRQRFTGARRRATLMNVVADDPEDGHRWRAPSWRFRSCEDECAVREVASRLQQMELVSADTGPAAFSGTQ